MFPPGGARFYYVFVNEARCDLSSEIRAEEESHAHQTTVIKHRESSRPLAETRHFVCVE